ncbi:hypothetical protein LCGC14_1640530 [marine sediment metagenome]|uniref:Uncharacterized protein n=1 Tax=marine sediment metagenome TaxID=412755 RepID=A0A0F9IM80_9ZZZZ
MFRKVTGSSDTPITDSISRGVIGAALMEVLVLIARKTDLLTAEDVADFAAIVVLAASILWGLWDRFGRPRLPSA